MTEDAAELAVIGIALEHPKILANGSRPALTSAHFRQPHTGQVWDCMLALADTGVPVDPIVLANHLQQVERQPQQLRQMLGVVEAATGHAGVRDNLDHYVELVSESYRRRRLDDLAATIRSRLDQGDDPAKITTTIRQSIEETAATEAGSTYRFVSGGSFILDLPSLPAALWGKDSDVLLADGEALIIAGSQGTGKTTLGQQLALGRAGFPENSQLLGYPIEPGGRVLYLAMDRPRQASRSFRRMVGAAWRSELDARITVWPGPPPQDLARHPEILTRLCQAAEADTCIVDSVKDAAIGLTDDEVGAGWNRARQLALVNGVQLVELHHLRKTLGREQARAQSLDDLYGSTWITAGAGSVILLAGQPGEDVVELRHLKQPAAEVGPLRVRHDHAAGRSSIEVEPDLVELAGSGDGITAIDAAAALFDTRKPSRGQKEQARRRLGKLTHTGLLVEVSIADSGGNEPTRWRPK